MTSIEGKNHMLEHMQGTKDRGERGGGTGISTIA